MNKKEFTKSIIEEAELNIEYSEAINAWWITTCETQYRLSNRGYKTLATLTPSFEFPLKCHPNSKMLLQLGKLNCAYFLYGNIGKMVVYVFSTKIATIIQLYGNIEKYLNTLE